MSYKVSHKLTGDESSTDWYWSLSQLSGIKQTDQRMSLRLTEGAQQLDRARFYNLDDTMASLSSDFHPKFFTFL